MTNQQNRAIRFSSVAPQFSVPDVVGTVAYYRDVLGFTVCGYWDGSRVVNEPGTRLPLFAIVQRDSVRVFFSLSPVPTSTRASDGAYDAYFSVQGVDALAADLAETGADVLEGPVVRTYGAKELVVRDCNGLVLSFGEEGE